MAIVYDFLLSRLKVCEAADRIAELGSTAVQLDSRVSVVEDAVERLGAAELTLLENQFAFYHADGWQTFDRLECGEFAQTGPYPVDWRFGSWSHDGLIMQFNTWA